MRFYPLTAAAVDAIRAHAHGEAFTMPSKNPDGTFAVPFHAETIAQVQRYAFTGETLSDTLIRILNRRDN